MSDTPIDTTRSDRPAPVGPLALWFAILGAPVAWAVQLALGDMFSELGCEAGGFSGIRFVLLGISAVATAVGAWALVVAWRSHRAMLAVELDDVPRERATFMALGGILVSVLFLLVIVLGGFAPHLFLEVCGS
jgi:hypothetical protein